MALSPELLEILVCPADKEALELKPDQSGLKCTKCRRVYPIKDDRSEERRVGKECRL